MNTHPLPVNMNKLLFGHFEKMLRESPDKKFLTFVGDDGSDKVSLTRREFDRRATTIARALLDEYKLQPGDVVLLVYPQSLEFCLAFWACLCIGVIPAPVAPPNPFKLQQDMPNFKEIVQTSGARLVLSESFYMNAKLATEMARIVGLARTAWPKMQWIRTDKIKPGAGGVLPSKNVVGADIAYLQFTSGSTSVPKGVQVSFGNIEHQLAMQQRDSRVGPDSVGVLWVPQFHDMCLIGGIVSAIAGNGHLFLISPLAFLKDPKIWMNVMSRVKATHTAAPNFALKLLSEKTTTAERRGWDLRALKVLGVGGEPNIGPDARAFLDHFSESGLAPEAYSPCYGMAEHTLVISLCGAGQHYKTLLIDKEIFEKEKRAQLVTKGGTEVMSNGRPGSDIDLRVLDPVTLRELPEGAIGEFWVSSASNGSGYYNQPEASRATFENKLQSKNFLRTGDLGFVNGGEIYITGRLKDLIIIRGRNIYPQDVERAILDQIPAIRRGSVSVFSIGKNMPGQEEKLIVLCEPEDAKMSASDFARLLNRITQVVSETASVACADILLLKEGSLVKTASGKIKRAACSELYTSGALRKATLKGSIQPVA
jgi:acyl-CoA synthetase (AMP-forming)/AMP-acid ligase II